MIRELNDARYALGVGIVFVGYAAFLLVDRWIKDRRVRQDTRAKLILNSEYGADRRDKLRIAEGISE